MNHQIKNAFFIFILNFILLIYIYVFIYFKYFLILNFLYQFPVKLNQIIKIIYLYSSLCTLKPYKYYFIYLQIFNFIFSLFKKNALSLKSNVNSNFLFSFFRFKLQFLNKCMDFEINTSTMLLSYDDTKQVSRYSIFKFYTPQASPSPNLSLNEKKQKTKNH